MSTPVLRQSLEDLAQLTVAAENALARVRSTAGEARAAGATEDDVRSALTTNTGAVMLAVTGRRYAGRMKPSEQKPTKDLLAALQESVDRAREGRRSVKDGEPK